MGFRCPSLQVEISTIVPTRHAWATYGDSYLESIDNFPFSRLCKFFKDVGNNDAVFEIISKYLLFCQQSTRSIRRRVHSPRNEIK